MRLPLGLSLSLMRLRQGFSSIHCRLRMSVSRQTSQRGKIPVDCRRGTKSAAMSNLLEKLRTFLYQQISRDVD